MSNQEALEKLAQNYNKCTACSLHRNRQNLVFGTGSPEAKIIFVGEAPGYNEDVSGQPFCGKSGNLLKAELSRCGILPQDCYFTNLVCCSPKHEEISDSNIISCFPRIIDIIRIIDPIIICPLGQRAAAHVLQALCHVDLGYCDYGFVYQHDAQFVMPLWPPAQCLHVKERLDALRKDLASLSRFVETYKGGIVR